MIIAYDTTWRHSIMRDLHDLGIRGRLATFIENFLADRWIQVRVGSTLSERFDQAQGVPQGSILLWAPRRPHSLKVICTLEHLHHFDHTWECLFILYSCYFRPTLIYRCLVISSAPQVGVTLVYQRILNTLKPLGQSKPNFMWSILRMG